MPLGKFPRGILNKFRQRPTLPRSLPRSTIGAEELNFRVRNGNGCGLLAIVTGKLKKEKYREAISKALKRKRYGQASRPISTSLLNALLHLHIWPINLVVYEGSSVLMSPSEGISYLEVGFPLRCFQRLSNPNIATQLCRWRDNWYTRGSSIPVLSY